MIWPEYSAWTWAGLAALGLLTLLTALFAWLRRRRVPGLRFPARPRLDGVKRGWRARLVFAPVALRGVALILLFIALTRPQLADEETAEVEGIDIVVALDMSGSMSSVDISDEALLAQLQAGELPADRFHVAVDVLRDFIQGRKYDRVSLVIFGKQAFVQFPLTLDYGAMLRILDRMALDDIDGDATVIGNALSKSLSRLEESEAKTKLVILLTDGEENGSNVSPMEMATEAKRRGVPIFPILVGTEDQSRRPTQQRDFFTGLPLYQKVDNPVNPALLEQIAEATGGRFYRAGDRDKLAHDFHDILDTFDKSRLVDYAAAERAELFGWFLIPGLLLLLLEVLLSQTILRRFP
ncbi:VWA domain-containing protein [Myxococcota bacterium]|nr:VWA domain-containing protein [Myxococcota bacterium]